MLIIEEVYTSTKQESVMSLNLRRISFFSFFSTHSIWMDSDNPTACLLDITINHNIIHTHFYRCEVHLPLALNL